MKAHKKTKSIQTLVVEWLSVVDISDANARLVRRKVSPSLVEKVLSGRYRSELSPLYRAIFLEEMALDGITVSAVKSA